MFALLSETFFNRCTYAQSHTNDGWGLLQSPFTSTHPKKCSVPVSPLPFSPGAVFKGERRKVFRGAPFPCRPFVVGGGEGRNYKALFLGLRDPAGHDTNCRFNRDIYCTALWGVFPAHNIFTTYKHTTIFLQKWSKELIVNFYFECGHSLAKLLILRISRRKSPLVESPTTP